MHEHFVSFAAYNRWANRRVYAAAAALDDAEYRADGGAFFGSVHRTLNHILVADGMWLRRITGEGEAADRLDAILHEDLAGLTAARERQDARIIALVERLDEAALAAPVSYRTVDGTPYTNPLAVLLTHLFNHQTHHRGQVHALLTGLGRDAPPLDYMYFIRETTGQAG